MKPLRDPQGLFLCLGKATAAAGSRLANDPLPALLAQWRGMQTELPVDALLSRYARDADGRALAHYTDCFELTIDDSVDLRAFVRAFYTTALFRSERIVLSLAGLRSSDADVDRLLDGHQEHFAAWTVEDRTHDQLLMCDVKRRTRSWFMTEPVASGTRLRFGSAVTASDAESIPRAYSILLRLHRLYSRALLRAAWRRLRRR